MNENQLNPVNFEFFVLAPLAPVSIEVQPSNDTRLWAKGEVAIHIHINPPARYNTTVTVEYNCLDTGCNSIKIPQCTTDIPRKS